MKALQTERTDTSTALEEALARWEELGFFDAFRSNSKQEQERAEQLLDFVGLYEKRWLRSGSPLRSSNSSRS